MLDIFLDCDAHRFLCFVPLDAPIIVHATLWVFISWAFLAHHFLRFSR